MSQGLTFSKAASCSCCHCHGTSLHVSFCMGSSTSEEFFPPEQAMSMPTQNNTTKNSRWPRLILEHKRSTPPKPLGAIKKDKYCVTYRLWRLPRCQALCVTHGQFFPFQSGVCPVCLENGDQSFPVAGLKFIAIAYKIGSGKAALLSALAANKHCHKVSFNIGWLSDSTAFPK